MAFPDISKLFKTASPETETVTVKEIDSISEMQPGESYTSFGKKMCMISNGSTLTLRTILQRIYHFEKSRQLNDENLQIRRRNNILKDIEKKDVEMSDAQTQMKKIKQDVENLTDDISELKAQRIEAINKNGQLNKMARLKLILGCIILFILTAYLFVFYSSTFYSAFFKDFGSSDLTIGAAMFDAQTFPNALEAGLGELVFILSAPIIFMGLGFALHFFSVQKGISKYFKITAIVLVTFIFDCILAYAIAKKIYDVEIISSWGDNIPPFSIPLALSDNNVWAVIFCGFVVYIIWGIVFDMTMTAYEDMRSNKKEIGQIDCQINNKKQLFAEKQTEYSNLQGIIEKLSIERNSLTNSLASKAMFDPNIIKQSFSQFFQGWTTVLGALLLPDEESKKVYDQEVNSFINIPNKNPQ